MSLTTNTPAPAQEARLTEDEIRAIWVDHGLDDEAVEDFARALESALLSKLRAPVADERAAFETFQRGAGLNELYLERHPESGQYMWTATKEAWETWQARAALASAPVAGEVQQGAITTRCPSGVLSMDGASLHMQRDGSGQIVIAEDIFTLEDDRSEGPDGPQGSVHWVARLAASELIALRDFLTGHARPSDDALWDQTLTERDEYHDIADKLANAIADHLLVEIGEHSSSNCPWMRALEAIENAAPQASEAVRILFPTHLRKMWSGGEVQAWLDEYQGVTAPKPSTKGSLEHYRKWQAEQASEAQCSCPSGDGSLRWPCPAKHPAPK